MGEGAAFGDVLGSGGTLTFDLPTGAFLVVPLVTFSYSGLLPFPGSQQQVVSCPLSLFSNPPVSSCFLPPACIYTYTFRDMFKMLEKNPPAVLQIN